MARIICVHLHALSYHNLLTLRIKDSPFGICNTIINGFVKADINEKTTTIEIAAEDESVTEDIASDTETQ